MRLYTLLKSQIEKRVVDFSLNSDKLEKARLTFDVLLSQQEQMTSSELRVEL